MEKVTATRSTPFGNKNVEGFSEMEQLAIWKHLKSTLDPYLGMSFADLNRHELESLVLSKMKEICDDELAIHWNQISRDTGRVSFSIYPKSSTYSPQFAPGVTITLK